jgi:hypothetical protein
MSVPCPTCVDQISPYDPRGWAYLKDVPSDGNYTSELCNEGDGYLGIITNRCTDSPTYPKAPNGTPYLSFLKESCPPPAGKYPAGPCIGSSVYGLGECRGDKYGECGIGYHRWFARDWPSELSTTAQQLNCCLNILPQAARTQWCPQDLWYGSQRCQSLVASTSTPATSGVGSSMDAYLNLNLSDAGAIDPTPVFAALASEWAQVAGSAPIALTDPMVGLVLKYQSSFPTVVGPILEQACASTTGADVVADSTGTIGKLCGCYLPATEYYMDGIIPRECQGLCQVQSAVGGVPIYVSSGGGASAPKVCTQSTCVFDNVTVSFINSVGGGVNFSQVCGECSAGGACTCIMDGVTVNSVNSSIPGIDLPQNCAGTGPINPIPPPSSWGTWVWVGVGLAVVLGGVGVWYLSRRKK